jgi:hypothetical protein
VEFKAEIHIVEGYFQMLVIETTDGFKGSFPDHEACRRDRRQLVR